MTETMYATNHLGGYQIVWAGRQAEVRDSNQQVVFRGTRAACKKWLKAKSMLVGK